MLKVLLIDVNCKHSSTGKIVYDLYSALNSQGHTAAICYGRGPLVKEPNIFKFGLDAETWFHALLTRITGLTGYFSPLSTMRLLRFIKRFQPDVVHIHELHAYFVNIGPVMRYLKAHNIKTVWTFHCEFMYTGKCGHANECEKWKTQCGSCPQLREYPKSLFFDFTKKMFEDKKKWFENFKNLTIVTPSMWLAQRVRESYLASYDIRIIYNGVDTEIFKPTDSNHLKKHHNIKENEKVLLTVMPDIMNASKGAQHFIKLANKMREYPIRFIIISANGSNVELPQNITTVQLLSNQYDLAVYYTLADVFVLCSKKETFSLTCAEAICCGTRVVGFEAGAPEQIFLPPYGNFVPYGDINRLEQMILCELAVGKNVDEVAHYGFMNYSKKTMCNNCFSIYNELDC